MGCKRCDLHEYRTKIVRGRGNPDTATILIIGEAPGKSEDVLGTAFIGESGKLLDDLLQRAGIPAHECYMTNTVLCRPTDKRGGENREPTEQEVYSCLPNVLNVIDGLPNIVAVIFAGKVSKKWYGQRFKHLESVNIMHPSALLRQGGPASSFFRDNINALKEFYEKIV